MPDESSTPSRVRDGAVAAARVAGIVAAAEQTAERIRSEAETRVRERISEGDRAAEYRITAAEEEAQEILAEARAEAAKILRDARERDEQAKTTATSEALTIVGRAQENAEQMVTDATQTAARHRSEAEKYTRDLLTDARSTASEVRSEGLELVANLRQMGDSLRANADRLLKDVQGIHSSMVTRIDRAGPRGSSSRRDAALDGGTRRARSDGGRAPRERPDPDDLPDVPEFIPRR